MRERKKTYPINTLTSSLLRPTGNVCPYRCVVGKCVACLASTYIYGIADNKVTEARPPKL